MLLPTPRVKLTQSRLHRTIGLTTDTDSYSIFPLGVSIDIDIGIGSIVRIVGQAVSAA